MPNELSILKDVTSIQLENFKNEVITFCNRVKKISQQIKSVGDNQFSNLLEFIDVILVIFFKHFKIT